MSKAKETRSTGVERLDRALRLIFERKGERLKLASVQRVRMIVPPPQALSSMRADGGSWFELRDRDDRPVYRRVIENPFTDIEVVVDDPERSLRRIALDEPRGAFFLIVPDIAGARRLVLNAESRKATKAAPAKRGKRGGKPGKSSLYEFKLSKFDRKER